MPIDEAAADKGLGLAAQQNVTATAAVPSEQAAKAISQEYSMGIPASGGMYAPQPDQPEEPADVHPAVQAYAASDPSRAAVTRDDWGPLSDLAHAIGKVQIAHDFFAPGAYAARDLLNFKKENAAQEQLTKDHPLLSMIPGVGFGKEALNALTVATAPAAGVFNIGAQNYARLLGSILPPMPGKTAEQTYQQNVADFNLAMFGAGKAGRVGKLTAGAEVPLSAKVVPEEGQTPQLQLEDKRGVGFEADAPRLPSPESPLPQHIFDEPPAPGTDPHMDEVYQEHAEKAEEFLDEAVKALGNTATATRSPIAIQEFANSVAPDATVSIPAEKLGDLWLTDTKFKDAWGELTNIAEVDGDNYRFPLSVYISKMADWHEQLKGDIAVGDGISVNEAKELPKPEEAAPPVNANQTQEQTTTTSKIDTLKAIHALYDLPQEQWQHFYDTTKNIWGELSTQDFHNAIGEILAHPEDVTPEEKPIVDLLEQHSIAARAAAEAKPTATSAQPEYDEDIAASMGVSFGDFMHATGKEFPEPEDFAEIDPEDQREIAEAKEAVAAAVNKVAADHWLRQLFNGASALGMSPEQFRQYSLKGQKAFEAAKAKLWEQTLARTKDKYNRDWQNAYKQQYNHALNLWMAKPIIKAEHALRYNAKDQTTNIETKWVDKDGKPITFYHASTHSNVGTPDNPWKLMGYNVISFSEDPAFANTWAEKHGGGINFDPFYVHTGYKQERAPTLYITHLKVKAPADYRIAADVDKAADWLGGSKGPLQRGDWHTWENPEMWKDLGWDGARMVEGDSQLEKIAAGKSKPNACVANPEQILFRYAVRFEEQNYKLALTNQHDYPAYYWDSLPNSFFSKDGFDADTIAEVVGYDSGMEMLDELNQFEKGREKTPFMTYFLGLVKQEARIRTFAELYGIEPKDPKGLTLEDVKQYQANKALEDAQAAFASPEITDLLIDQFNVLRSANGETPITAAQVQELALKQFDTLPLKRAVNLRFFERVLSSSGRKAETLILQGKVPEALPVKQRQIVYQYQLIEAHNLNREVRRNDSRWKKLAKSPTKENVDQDFLNRIHEILSRLDYNVKRNPEELANAIGGESLSDFIVKENANGKLIPEVPLPLDPANMTVEEYRGVAAMLKALFQYGKAEREVERAGKQQALDDFIAEVNGNFDKIGRGNGITKLKGKGPRGTATRMAQGVNAWMIQPERLVEAIDLDTLDGPMVASVDRPLQDAAVWKADKLKEFGKELDAFMKTQPKEWVDSLKQKLDLGRFNDAPIISDRGELVRFILNVGNAGNYEKLIRGYGLTEEMAEAFLGYARKADWDFAQKIWDMHDSLWPKIESEYREMTGLAPVKVKPREIVNQFGEYKGGYFPISYDWLQAEMLGMPVPRHVADENPFGREYVSAFPANPYTKGRTNYYAPILLNFDTVLSGLNATVHDLAFRKALMQASKIINHPQIKKGVIETFGPPYLNQLQTWVKYVAHESLMDEGHAAWMANFLRHARVNISNVGLMYRMSVVALHGPMAFLSTLAEAEKLALLRAMGDLYLHPNAGETHAFITENSGEIRHRMRNTDRDINDAMNDLILKKGFVTEFQKYGYHAVGWSDQFSARPAWLYYYRKMIAEEASHEEAAKRADQFVRQVHGSGAPVNLAGVQRGGLGPHGELGKFAGLFTSFLNHAYNRNWRFMRLGKRAVDEAKRGDWDGAKRDFSRTASYSLFFIVAGMLWYAFEKGTIQGQKRAQGTHGLIAGFAHNVLGAFPMANTALSYLERGEMDNMILQPLTSMIGTDKRPGTVRDIWKVLTGHADHVSARWLQHAMETTGYWTGLGLGGPGLSAQYLWDLGTGKEKVTSFSSFVQGILFGPRAAEKGKGMRMRIKL